MACAETAGHEWRPEHYRRTHDDEIEMFRCWLPAHSSGRRHLLQPPLSRDTQFSERNAGGRIDDRA